MRSPLEQALVERRRLPAARSLAPTRTHASDVASLVDTFARTTVDPERVEDFERALETVAAALARSFPENIFGDLDSLAAALWNADVATRASLTRHLVALFHGFGIQSVIRFRYAHDFLYGFDWARWVAKDPIRRSDVGPYDIPFLIYLERRQHEITARVHAGDETFGDLEPGTYRNPFCFARHPAQEVTLHERLAALDLIPIRAWNREGERRWDLPFTELRAQLAMWLGLSTRPAHEAS